MEFLKLLKTGFLIVIYFVLIAVLILVGKIPSERVKSTVTIIVCVMFCFHWLWELYHDFKDKRFMTNKFILIADFVTIAAFGVLSLAVLISYDKTDIDVLWMRYRIVSKAGMILTLMEGLKLFLKSKRFIKMIEQEQE